MRVRYKFPLRISLEYFLIEMLCCIMCMCDNKLYIMLISTIKLLNSRHYRATEFVHFSEVKIYEFVRVID